MGKRVTAIPPKSKATVSEEHPKATIENGIRQISTIDNVTKQQTIKAIDPNSCIPLFLVRNLINNAVRKLKSIFTGAASTYSTSLNGFVSGKPTSVVVPLVKELESYIADYFVSEGYTAEDAEQMKESSSIWYGIIDGCHVHSAILELKEEHPDKWGDFKWNVIVVKPVHGMEEYRQLARVENERNKQLYHYDTTIYDLLRGLRLEFDFLQAQALKKSRTGKRGAKVNHRDVARRYDGGHHINNTSVKQAVTVASRLSQKTIDTIGIVCNKECADVMLKDPKYNKHNFKSENEILAIEDCRLFQSFVCFGSLRSSKAFMNAMIDGHEEAQVNTIYRMQHWSELNHYKAVQPKVITEQFNLAILALKEEDKFLSVIEEETWPAHMETCRENTIRTTLCDKELMVNSGNDGDVLPSIWTCFKRLYPAKARAIENVRVTSTFPEEEPPLPPDTQNENENEGTGPDDHQNDREREKEEQKKYEHNLKLKRNRNQADQSLHDTGIYTYQMNYDDFSKQIWSSSSKRVDLVISSIPKNMEMEELDTLPSFCKRVLKTGCYAFFIVTEEQFTFLKGSFRKQDFKVIDQSFKIMYDVTTIQRKSITDFPQKNSDIAIIVKTPGQHPDGYSPVFSEREPCSSLETANFASVINIKACQDLLRKPNENKSVLQDEKSVELFTHVIKMLSPPNGSIIDPVAGALTAALSCLRCGRKCIAVESSKDVFRFALGRTRVHITPTATMQNLSDYTDPIDLDSDDEEECNQQGPPTKKRRIQNESPNNNDTNQSNNKNQPMNTKETNNYNNIQTESQERIDGRNPSAGENSSINASSSRDRNVGAQALIDEKEGVDALIMIGSNENDPLT